MGADPKLTAAREALALVSEAEKEENPVLRDRYLERAEEGMGEHLATALAEIDRLTADLAEARATLDNERGEGEPPSEGWEWTPAASLDVSWYAQRNVPPPTGYWSAARGGTGIDGQRHIVQRHGDVWMVTIVSAWSNPVTKYPSPEPQATARAAMRAADAKVPR